MKLSNLKYLPLTFFYSLLVFTLLSLSAGGIDWINPWIYSIFYIINSIIVLPLVKRELIEERIHIKKDVKKWDKPIVLGLVILSPIMIFVVAGLDIRFAWSRKFSLFTELFAFALSVSGLVFAEWAMLTNPFFSSLVRIQTDRSHHVISQGPYRYIRHPGYLGAIIHFLLLPLFFGSLWAYIPVAILLFLIVLRTALEDRTLKNELEGYEEYSHTVRYRLVPGVW